jgi:hypothetical protein
MFTYSLKDLVRFRISFQCFVVEDHPFPYLVVGLMVCLLVVDHLVRLVVGLYKLDVPVVGPYLHLVEVLYYLVVVHLDHPCLVVVLFLLEVVHLVLQASTPHSPFF